MKLNLIDIESLMRILDDGPNFDINRIRERTIKNPKWLAFGTGNIFRGYIARVAQEMTNKGQWDYGLICVESFSDEPIKATLDPHDNLCISISLNKDGQVHTNLIANLAESFLIADRYDRMLEIFTDPGFQVASYTITEKGYGIRNSDGSFTDSVRQEMKGEAKKAKNLMVQTAFLLYARYKKNKAPLTLLSIDNLSENGRVLRRAVYEVAEAMVADGRFESDFLEYLEDEKKVSFPWTMIDKITPSPSQEMADYLVEKLGIDDAQLIDRGLNRPPFAPFVNAEEAEYLVIEDAFANGRPPFEASSALLTDRETVKKIETMKVTTCLNPLHTAMSVYGVLLNIPTIAECMKDQEIVSLIKSICYKEALPVVVDPGIIKPKDFAEEVIEVRLPNPFIPDQPERICMDTSQKVSVRFGHTIKTYMEREDKEASDLVFIPLAIAGWLRYLLAVRDNGQSFQPSSDPLLEYLQSKLREIKWDHFKNSPGLEEILHDKSIFGVDLFEAGLAEKVISFLKQECQGEGAVRTTLKKYVSDRVN